MKTISRRRNCAKWGTAQNCRYKSSAVKYLALKDNTRCVRQSRHPPVRPSHTPFGATQEGEPCPLRDIYIGREPEVQPAQSSGVPGSPCGAVEKILADIHRLSPLPWLSFQRANRRAVHAGVRSGGARSSTIRRRMPAKGSLGILASRADSSPDGCLNRWRGGVDGGPVACDRSTARASSAGSAHRHRARAPRSAHAHRAPRSSVPVSAPIQPTRSPPAYPMLTRPC